jgi:aminoglycoside phosphotransferase (APT) family kinase protein
VVHHDYKEDNVVIEQTEGRWRVSGLFDLMEGYFGDAEEDLVRSVLHYCLTDRDKCAKAFIAAYVAARPLRPSFRQRFVINMLHDCLLVWRYRKANGPPFQPQLRFRAWAEAFVCSDPFSI